MSCLIYSLKLLRTVCTFSYNGKAFWVLPASLNQGNNCNTLYKLPNDNGNSVLKCLLHSIWYMFSKDFLKHKLTHIYLICFKCKYLYLYAFSLLQYASYEIDWIMSTFSSIYKSLGISVFLLGLFILLCSVFSVSITKTLRSSHKTEKKLGRDDGLWHKVFHRQAHFFHVELV